MDLNEHSWRIIASYLPMPNAVMLRRIWRQAHNVCRNQKINMTDGAIWAIDYDYVNILRYYHENGLILTSRLLRFAVLGGIRINRDCVLGHKINKIYRDHYVPTFNCLKYMAEFTEWTKECIEYAAYTDLPRFKFVSQYYKIPDFIIDNVAEAGTVDILLYLINEEKEDRYEIRNHTAITNAVINGHAECLKIMFNNMIATHGRDIIKLAILGDNVNVLDILINYGECCLSSSVAEYAIELDSLECLQYYSKYMYLNQRHISMAADLRRHRCHEWLKTIDIPAQNMQIKNMCG